MDCETYNKYIMIDLEHIESNLLESSLKMVREIYEYYRLNDKLNTQEFLNWLDELNRISVMNWYG